MEVSLLEPPVDPRGTAARGTFNGTEAEVELQPQPSTVAGGTTTDCLYDTDTLTETRAPQTHREEAPREERAERTSLRYLKEVLEPERQRRQVQQVRHSEVHQVNSQLVPLLQLKGSVVQRVHVGRNANLQTQDHSPCSTSWSARETLPKSKDTSITHHEHQDVDAGEHVLVDLVVDAAVAHVFFRLVDHHHAAAHTVSP